MSLDTSEVKKIAHLARLSIADAELAGYSHQLANILELVTEMSRVDTQHIEPMAHPLPMTQRLRADEVLESDRRAVFQAIAPSVEAGLYLVPKVIE